MTDKEAERFYLGGNLEDEGKGESGLKGCVQSIREEGELGAGEGGGEENRVMEPVSTARAISGTADATEAAARTVPHPGPQRTPGPGSSGGPGLR